MKAQVNKIIENNPPKIQDFLENFMKEKEELSKELSSKENELRKLQNEISQYEK
jgi:predicted  nucleic acid-binding Zn-ribbon protein